MLFRLTRWHMWCATCARSECCWLITVVQMRVSQWNARDDYVLWWIGEQRAVWYDQVQRLLARESSEEPQDPQKLPLSRTRQIIQR